MTTERPILILVAMSHIFKTQLGYFVYDNNHKRCFIDKTRNINILKRHIRKYLQLCRENRQENK